MTPLLLNITQLSEALNRSRASLDRDAASGRLPAAVRLGGSRKWRTDEITAWVAAGCPCRKTWEAMQARKLYRL